MTLARSEFKLRYFGSVLGYVWSLMRPLLFFGVLYLFFTNIIRFGAGIPHYGVYLLTSVVLWNFFAEATAGSVACLVTREPLLRKIRFPRMVIPLSVSLTATFNLGMNSIAVVIFALLNGVTPTRALAGDDPDRARLRRVRHRDRDAAVGRLCALPRRGADLGSAAPGLVLLLADHVRGLELRAPLRINLRPLTPSSTPWPCCSRRWVTPSSGVRTSRRRSARPGRPRLPPR